MVQLPEWHVGERRAMPCVAVSLRCVDRQRAALAAQPDRPFVTVDLETKAVASLDFDHRHLVCRHRATVESIRGECGIDGLDRDDAAITKRSRRSQDCRTRRHFLDIAQQLQREVDAVDAELVDDAARHVRSREEPVRPVGARRRIADRCAVHTPDRAVDEQDLRGDDFRKVAMHEAHLQIDAIALRGADDPVARGHRAGHRLLQQDRLARIGRGDRDLFVGRIRRADDDRVDVAAFECLPPISDDVGDPELRGERSRALLRPRGKQTHHRGLRTGVASRCRDPRQVILGDEPGAEHRDADACATAGSAHGAHGAHVAHVAHVAHCGHRGRVARGFVRP